MDLSLPVIRLYLAKSGANVFSKAMDVLRERSIFNLSRDNQTYQASCVSSVEAGLHYVLWAELSNGQIVSAHCNCPVGSEGRCKHVGALLLQVRETPLSKIPENAPSLAADSLRTSKEDVRSAQLAAKQFAAPPAPMPTSPVKQQGAPSPNSASCAKSYTQTLVATTVFPGMTRISRTPPAASSPSGSGAQASRRTASPERDTLIKKLEWQINDLRRVLQERDAQLETERKLRIDAEKRADKFEQLARRMEAAPTQSPSPPLLTFMNEATQELSQEVLSEDPAMFVRTQSIDADPLPPSLLSCDPPRDQGGISSIDSFPATIPVVHASSLQSSGSFVKRVAQNALRKSVQKERRIENGKTSGAANNSDDERDTDSPLKKIIRPLVAESQGSLDAERPPSIPTPSEDEFAVLAQRHLKNILDAAEENGKVGSGSSEEGSDFIAALLREKR